MGTRKKIDWDAQPLGSVPDTVFARRMGVAQTAVCAARRRRGIPAYRDPSRPIIQWDKQPLGLVGDTDLAHRLGVTANVVYWQRIRRGIPPFGKRRKKRVNPATIDWEAQPLGKDTDRKIAKRLNVAHQVVSRQRELRGIPPFDRGAWWDSQPLGQVPDTEITSPRGMHRSAALIARKLRGIAAYEPRITYNGESKTIPAWADAVGLEYSTLWQRLRKGWSLSRALELPAGPILVEHQGEAKTLPEWARSAGIKYHTLLDRLWAGWSLVRALGTPAERGGLERGLRAAERELRRRQKDRG